jgi:hypothetical protein
MLAAEDRRLAGLGEARDCYKMHQPWATAGHTSSRGPPPCRVLIQSYSRQCEGEDDLGMPGPDHDDAQQRSFSPLLIRSNLYVATKCGLELVLSCATRLIFPCKF